MDETFMDFKYIWQDRAEHRVDTRSPWRVTTATVQLNLTDEGIRPIFLPCVYD